MTQQVTSAFSFHCMICFEEFHPDERYPVVLPCGHTYVCNTCANRLDKCMECRMPLYTIVKPSKGAGAGPNGVNGGGVGAGVQHHNQLHHQRSAWSNARSSGGHGGGLVRSLSHSPGESPPPQHPQPPIKKRLPLPKNVVLLSLIEATELATQDVQKKFSEDASAAMNNISTSTNNNEPINLNSRPSVYSMNSMVDAEDEEEEKIRVGTSLAVGVAGTYAVAAREGLTIVSSRPRPDSRNNNNDDSYHTNSAAGDSSSAKQSAEQPHPEEEVDSIVQNMQYETAKSDKESPSKSPSTDKDSCKLSFGDRVQVVAIDGGWAKLARGYGYVRIREKNNLVKVGGAVDRACKLEAMLRNLSQRRRELRIEQSKIDNQFIRLMNDLQLSLQNDEDLTVIAADAFSEPPTSSAAMEPTPESSAYEVMIATEKKEDDVSRAPPGAARARASSSSASSVSEVRHEFDHLNLVKPTKLNSPNNKLSSAVQVPRASNFVCFAGDVFSMGDAPGTATPNQQPCSPANSMDGLVSSFFSPSAAQPSPNALRAGAQAWRERHGRTASQGIDFRTGMSGHMALLSTHAHPHEYLEPVSSYSSTGGYHFPKMSSHTGLTMFKTRSRGLLSSLTLPTFGISPLQEDNNGGGSNSNSSGTQVAAAGGVGGGIGSGREGVYPSGSM